MLTCLIYECVCRYTVEKLIERGLADKRRAGGGKKSKKLSVVQYKVRWAGYSKDDDSWVDADQITPSCIAAFNGEEMSGKVPTSLLATIPTAKHPSSPGYAAFKK